VEHGKHFVMLPNAPLARLRMVHEPSQYLLIRTSKNQIMPCRCHRPRKTCPTDPTGWSLRMTERYSPFAPRLSHQVAP
jgi:hypothetical protein